MPLAAIVLATIIMLICLPTLVVKIGQRVSARRDRRFAAEFPALDRGVDDRDFLASLPVPVIDTNEAGAR